MLTLRSGLLALLLSAGHLVGCEATAEDIEHWKGTQRGPAKITTVVLDSRYPYELRGRAAVALVEIVRWENLNLAFQKLPEQERQNVIHAMVPRLQEMYASGANQAQGDIPPDTQVNAKDAMVEIYELAKAVDQDALREPLIDWITSDFNGHYLQGRRNIATIVEKLGIHGATALAKIINRKNVAVINRITALVVEHGSAESKHIASENLSKIARDLGDQIRTDVWKAMATVCGDGVRRYTLEYAARHKANVEAQQNGIICVLGGGVSGCGDGCLEPSDIDSLFSIAEDEDQDERIRAASYDALREHATAAHVNRVMKLLDDRDIRYRATGTEIAVHLGGAKVIPAVIERIADSREPWPWMLKNSRTNQQEYGYCNMGLGQLEQAQGARQVLLANIDHRNAFVRGSVANMLGVVGTTEDIPRLESITADSGRLKGWIPDRVGAQAELAIKRIRDTKRPADTSVRRGIACGLNVR